MKEALKKVVEQDAGGNSTLTRLRAEVEFNRDKPGDWPTNDPSLTLDDLRALLALVEAMHS